jgi:flagellar protein FliS
MLNPEQVYQRQSVLNASPIKLVVKMYDLAIQATYKNDGKQFRSIISELIAGLNFEYEPSGELFEIYRYCQDLSRKEKYDEIRAILEPLRETWEEVSNSRESNSAMSV